MRGAPAAGPMPQKLRYGIVGLGWIGMVHAEAIQTAVPDAEIAAVCDIQPERLAERATKLGVACRYEDFRKLVRSDGLDAVYVCVPNHLHREVALAALEAGLHVFCEKPMAMNAGQAREMAGAAARAEKVLQLGMMTRQRPECRLVRSYIEEGFFGTISRVTIVLRRCRGVPGLGGWFTTKEKSGGGCLIDIGVHFLDLALWLTDMWSPKSVSAADYQVFGRRMRDYRFVDMWAGPPDYSGVCDVDDSAAAFVRFPDGATMSLDVSWALNARDDAYIEIFGEKAGVRLMDDGALTLITEMDGRLVDVVPQYAKDAKPFHVQARNFAAALRGTEQPAATAEQGVAVMELIDAIYRSSAEGREVAIR
jgi:predicted dehydrogenase